MKYKIVCVRDRAADVFGQPNFVNQIGAAVRSFADQINGEKRPDNPFAMHPEDFDLYEVGTYDDETAVFDTFTPKQLVVGKDLVR